MATNINKQRILSRKVFGTGSNASLTDCPNSCSVNFANVNGGAQTQWLSGAQGTAMTFGAGGIGDFSISFWMYPTNLSTGANMRIFDFGSGALTPPNGRIQMHINNNGDNIITTLKVNNTVSDPSGTSITFLQDTWTHITWTISRFADPVTAIQGKWYANGVFVGNTDTDPFSQTTNVVTTATTGPFYIGRSGATGMFEGNLDDFTIWDRALTAAEIVEIMGVSIDPTVCMNSLSFYDDLTHWWAMGDPNSSVSYPIIPDVIGVQDMEMKGMSASNIDCSSSPGDEWTYIPDAAFQAKLIASHSVTFPIPNYCLTSDVSGITAFTATFASIYNLTGIEDFAVLTTLTVNGNKMITLDVSQNTALTSLTCDSQWPKMISLNVSGATALTTLNCYDNNLTSLDVSNNTALLYLYCHDNQLTSLDVSTNTALTHLHCYSNQLTSLDVSTNTALIVFRCSDNQLTTLDLSANTALLYLYCHDNQLTSLDLSANTALALLYCYNNELTGLNLSFNTVLIYLDCQDNQLFSLDIKNGNNTAVTLFKTTGNTDLSCIDVDDPGWSATNWTNIDAWTSFSLHCLYTYIPDANFRTCLTNDYGVAFAYPEHCLTTEISGFTDIDCSYKSISDLTGIEDFAAITRLDCDHNNLRSLNLSANTNLDFLGAIYNDLITLITTGLTSLTQVWVNYNALGGVDVSTNTALEQLDVRWNKISSLDVSSNTALEGLNCIENKMTSLNVNGATALEDLYCFNNNLTSLDVSTNVLLDTFSCGGNNLTSLDVINNTILGFLDCSANDITSLYVTHLTTLSSLVCQQNQITGLIDVSNSTLLIELYVYDNQLTDLNVKNGNNSAIPSIDFNATSNLLTCISVSDTVWATNNWTSVDAGVNFTTNFPCP